MLCNQCSKEVPAETALWTQDLNAKSIVFCSAVCQEVWIDGQFPLRLNRRAAFATSQATYRSRNATSPN